VMEWAHLIVTAGQNTAVNGYGATEHKEAPPGKRALLQAWAKFYDMSHLPTYDEALAQKASQPEIYRDLPGGMLLHAELYKRRMRMSIEPFLLDADERAASEGKRAYVHAVGLGLGVWTVDESQGQLMLDVYADVLHDCPLPNVGVIDFSYFPDGCETCGGVTSGGAWPGRDLTIHFSRRDPADPLPSEPSMLLVAQYAWDGNSYPGNEYWISMLDASGDPAAACCSAIDVLQNPDLNGERVNGKTARVLPPPSSKTAGGRTSVLLSDCMMAP